MRSAVHTIVQRDAVLVTLMAAVIALSAFAVYQATRASDEADDRLDQARVLQAEATRQASHLRTLVDHDLNILGPYCASVMERDAERVVLLSPEYEIGGLVAADLKLRALRPLLQGDPPDEPCAAPPPVDGADGGYSVARARQAEAARAQQSDLSLAMGSGSGGAAEATAEAARLSQRERQLMAAGLLFALALFGLIGIDALGNRSQRPLDLQDRDVSRWQYCSFGVSSTAFLLGAVLLLLNVVDAGQLVLMGGVLAVVVLHRVRRLADELRGGGGPSPPSTVSGGPHWWAEVVGALTLVAFSASALGLSYVTTRERDERALSERRHSVAQQQQQLGEQAALRDLATVAQLAGLDAELAAANQSAAVQQTEAADDAEAIAARRTALAAQMEATERSVRNELTSLLRSGTTDDCRSGLSVGTTSPSTLLEKAADRPAVFAEYVFAQQEPARACDVLAAAARKNARAWASRASLFTVALVLLGLAGFLLALASDPDRSRLSARWLLAVGSTGLATGVLVSSLVPLQAATTSTSLGKAELVAFSRNIAAGHHNPCDLAIPRLDSAVDAFGEYGPAYAARAYARFCVAARNGNGTVLSSEVDPDSLPGIIDDFEKATDLGTRPPILTGNLAWAHILHGLQEGRGAESHLQHGLALTLRAISALDGSPSAATTATAMHSLRLNAALAHAGLGDEAAATTGYERAVQCLDPAQRCSGGGLLNPERRADQVLWALADLELLDDRAMDRYRDVIVKAFHGGTADVSGWDGARLDVFAQEVQVSGGHGSPPASAVVWYHRPDSQSSWGVLREPSLATLRPGDHLNRPVAARQLLPAGEYRADVYSREGRSASLLGSSELAQDRSRYSSRQLGISVVAPSGWEEQESTAGVTWGIGPSPTSGVHVRRVEGQQPESDVGAFLEDQLDRWLADRFGTIRDEPADMPGEYFLGLPDVVVREYEVLGIKAAAGFGPYGSTSACGGALFLAFVGGSRVEEGGAQAIFPSLVLEEPQQRLPWAAGTLPAKDLPIEVPHGWDAAVRPTGGAGDDFRAKHCETGTNVLVNEEPLRDRPLDAVLATELATYRAGGFPEFELQGRRTTEVPGSRQAVEIRFTWLSSNGPVQQRQVYATDGTTLTYLTFTAHRDHAERFAADADAVVRSFRLR